MGDNSLITVYLRLALLGLFVLGTHSFAPPLANARSLGPVVPPSESVTCCCFERKISEKGHLEWMGCEIQEGTECPKDLPFNYWTREDVGHDEETVKKLDETCKAGHVPDHAVHYYHWRER